jgi:uncharacterized protein YjbJ (UPF0337 family)
MIDKEKIKGVWNEAAGETKEHIGRALNNKELEQKGHAQEMKGKVQRGVGSVKDTASRVGNDVRQGFNNLKDDVD